MFRNFSFRFFMSMFAIFTVLFLSSGRTYATGSCLSISPVPTSFNGTVMDIHQQSDGKMLVVGFFTEYN